MYVDNIVPSLPSEDLLCDYFTSSRTIFKDVGFNLRSWASYSHALKELAKSENVQDSDPVTNQLGFRWRQIEFRCQIKTTFWKRTHLQLNREVLNESSVVYDPLQILSLITVRSEILIQSVWQRGLEWDELLSSELAKAAETEIPRCYAGCRYF